MSRRRIVTMVKKMADEHMKVAIDRDEFFVYSIDLIHQTSQRDAKIFFTAYMKTLHDEYGFGEKRLNNIHDKSVELIEKYLKDPSLWKKDTEELYSNGFNIADIKLEEISKNV